MKVALVLTGLPRNIKEGYHHFWKYLMMTYSPDVYTVYWQTDDHEEVHRFYGPISGASSPPCSFKSYQEGVEAEDSTSRYDERFHVGGYFRGLPMFHTWQAAASLIMYNTITYGFNYDMVIRGRFDLFNPQIDLDGIDLTKVNVSAHNWPNSPICDDNLMVTDQKNFLRLHTNIFNDVINYTKEHKRIYFQEKMLTEMINYKGLDFLVHKAHQLKFHFVRDIITQQP